MTWALMKSLPIRGRLQPGDGRQNVVAHGHQDTALSGAGSLTDRPEALVEQVRSAVDRTHQAGDWDEVFAGLPKLPIIMFHFPQQRKTLASTPPQQPRCSGTVVLSPQPIKVESAVHAGIPGASRGMRTRHHPLQEEDEDASHQRRSPPGKEKLTQHQGHLASWTGPHRPVSDLEISLRERGNYEGEFFASRRRVRAQ
jgi:hypothetical protein